MTRFKQIITNLFVLGTVLAALNVFASEFDPQPSKISAPELLLVREDAQGNRVLMSLDKAPKTFSNDNEMLEVIASAESQATSTSAFDGGAVGIEPSEFDSSTATPAWYYWNYPNRYNYWNNNYWYSYGYYSYYPRYTYNNYYYNNSYYTYYYYYRYNTYNGWWY